MTEQMVAATPELRHCREHLNALLWTCPDDHAVLRSTEGVFVPRPGLTPDGRYSCGLHEWTRVDGGWVRAVEAVAA